MKKYIYGTVLVAVLAYTIVFFFKPPETTNGSIPVILALTFQLPEGYEFTEGAPFALTWQTEGPDGVLSNPVLDKHFDPLLSPYKLIVMRTSGSRAAALNAHLYYCHKASRMCFQDDFKKSLPLGSQTNPAVSLVWKIIPKTGKG